METQNYLSCSEFINGEMRHRSVKFAYGNVSREARVCIGITMSAFVDLNTAFWYIDTKTQNVHIC